MHEAKFLIIEDDVTYVAKYRAYLQRGGISPDRIWPPSSGGPILSNARWISVTRELKSLQSQGWNPAVDMVVLIIDLALNDQGDPSEGGAQIEGSREFFEPYVLLVASNSADAFADRLGGKVDALLAKRDLEARGGEADGVFGSHRFWSAIRSAASRWAKRTGRSSPLPLLPNARVVGSEFSVRWLRGQLGDNAVDEIAQYVSDRHEAIEVPEVAVADGGFSGAAVLLLSFRLRSGRRAAALKISESEGLLGKEARASARAVAASGKFGYAFQSVQGPERIAIGGRTLYANEQVFVDGRTLEDFALGSDESSFAKMVRGLGELLAKATDSGLNDASRPLGVPDALALTDVQLLRFERSIEELEAIWSALQACTPGVNKRLGLNKAAFGALRGFARNWQGAVAAAFPSGVLLYEQHGDLHGRNLMVLSGQRDAPQLKFIDAARFGAWPALYDLCRLRLNLAVRLLDPPSSGLDHVPDRMQVWEDAWTNATLASSVGGKQVAKGLRRFLSLRAAIGGVVDEQSKRGLRSGEAARLVALCESFDLFKMVCYVDSSAPRRLWLAARLNAAMRQLRGR